MSLKNKPVKLILHPGASQLIMLIGGEITDALHFDNIQYIPRNAQALRCVLVRFCQLSVLHNDKPSTGNAHFVTGVTLFESSADLPDGQTVTNDLFNSNYRQEQFYFVVKNFLCKCLHRNPFENLSALVQVIVGDKPLTSSMKNQFADTLVRHQLWRYLFDRSLIKYAAAKHYFILYNHHNGSFCKKKICNIINSI